MSFVFWEDSAVEDVDNMQTTVNPQYHAAIGTAVAEIHDKLTRDPVGFSESRAGGFRIIMELPLAAWFWLSADGGRVNVLHVWFVTRRFRSP